MLDRNTQVQAKNLDADFSQYLDALRRHWSQGLLVFMLILFFASGLAVWLPAVYESEAIILIEQQEIPSEYVRSTVTSYADQRIQVISQRVMTTQNLGQIIEKYGLYEDDLERKPREVVLEEMRKDIQLDTISADVVDPRSGRPTEATIAFSLAYENQSASLAQKVTNELVTLFLNENLRSRTEMAQETSIFLDDEADKLGDQVADLETRLARFKEENVNSLPELMGRNFTVRDRTELELSGIDERIDSLRERAILIEAQLAQIPPLDVSYGEDGRRILSPRDRLKSLKTELIAARSRYGSSHPDVRSLEREVSALEDETGNDNGIDSTDLQTKYEASKSALEKLESQYGEGHPEVVAARKIVKTLKEELESTTNGASAAHTAANINQSAQPTNPAFLQVQAQLQSTRSEISSALERKADLEKKLEDYDKRLVESAKVEKEYRQITRQYETALAKLQEINAKRLEADVSESLEREQKGERFTLIEPPLLPERPSKPNRFAIFLIGFVLSLGGSAGAVSLLEAMDNKVRGRRGVIAVTGISPIGIIPKVDARAKRRRWRKRLVTWFAISAAALSIVLITVNAAIVPLDVLWFKAARILGL